MARSEQEENPLTVNLDLPKFGLEGLYNGAVQGEVAIKGSALKPLVEGNIELFNGSILLPQSPATETVATSSATFSTETVAEEKNPITDSIAFKDLTLTIGRNVDVVQPLLVNFRTTGELRVGGTLNDIRPAGVINLDDGDISLFSTQFRLDRSQKNEVTFTPTAGLDPHLNLRLTTQVTESGNRTIAIDGGASEVTDTTADLSGGSTRINVEATVNGLASKLDDSIQLTSSPSRSKTEIIGLLATSVVDSFTDGDTSLGFANLASNSRLFRNFENSLRDLIGLSEFRIFPISVTNNQSNNSSLALGVQLGLDVGNFNLGLSRILAADNPFQYSGRYRLGENIILRGATDLSGNQGAGIQFQTRW